MKVKSGKIILVLSLAAALMMLSTCNWPDYFADYSNTDGTLVNLIDGRGFGDTDTGGNSYWDFDRDDNATTGEANDYYLRFSAPTEAAVTGLTDLPSGVDITDVYRLEIPNLMPNGDFENTTDSDSNPVNGTQPQGWDYDSGAIESTSAPYTFAEVFTGSSIVANTNRRINNNTLFFSLQDDDQYLYDLTQLADGFVANETYSLRFDIRATNETVFDYSNGSDESYLNSLWALAISETLAVRSFPLANNDPQFTAEAGTSYLSIGTHIPEDGNIQNGYIDNIRIVRNDVRPYAYLLVPVGGDNTTDPALIDGWYRFSVYVRLDPTDTKGSSTVANRMQASAVSLNFGYRTGGADSASITGDPTVHINPAVDSSLDGDWSSWTEIEAYGRIEASRLRQYEDWFTDETEAYVELLISPTDTSLAGKNRDAGSILIAAPSLGFDETYDPETVE